MKDGVQDRNMMPFLEWSLPHNLGWRRLQPVGGYMRYSDIHAIRSGLSCVSNLSFLHWRVIIRCFSFFHEFVFDFNDCLNWSSIKVGKSKTRGCWHGRGLRGILASWLSWSYHYHWSWSSGDLWGVRRGRGKYRGIRRGGLFLETHWPLCFRIPSLTLEQHCDMSWWLLSLWCTRRRLWSFPGWSFFTSEFLMFFE